MRLLLLALALATACGGSQSSTVNAPVKPKVPEDPLALLPADSDLVLHVDVQRLRPSPQFKRRRTLVEESRSVQMLRDDCQIDILASRSLTFGGKLPDLEKPSGVGIARGFDREKATACFAKLKGIFGGMVTLENGMFSENAGGDESTFTVADESTVVGILGNPAGLPELKRLLDAGGVPLKSSPAFHELVAGVRTQDPIWFVVNGNAKAFDQFVAMNGARPRAIFGSLDVAGGVSLAARARLATSDEATKLAAMINDKVPAMARALVEKLDIRAERTDLVVEVKMTDEQIDNLAQLAGGWIGPSD